MILDVHMPGIGIDTEFFSPDAVERTVEAALQGSVTSGEGRGAQYQSIR